MSDTHTHPSDDNMPPLVLFEGKPVIDTNVKVTGTVKHVFAKPPRDFRQDEVVVVVTVLKVGKIAFPPGDDGCVREQTLEVQEFHELGLSELDTKRLLSEARAKTRREVELRYGEAPPGEGIRVTHRSDDEVRAARERMRAVGDEVRGEAGEA